VSAETASFEGKSAIVTGAGSGIGQAVTLALAAAGARVLAVDINMDSAEATAEQAPDRVSAHHADVSDREHVLGYAKAAAAQNGPPALFFNNAGVEGVHRSIVDTDPADWLKVVNINLNSMFWGLQAVLPYMRDARAGAVVNTGSILSLKAAPDRSDYVVTKHGVLGLTRSAASEMAPFGVRVNCLCPGPVETPLMRRSETLVNPDDPEFERRRFEEGTPMGRYAQPREIAETVLFLLRGDVAYLTGAAIAIDGGITSV
jgi:NAD(P)-dependent dehydrogenase (short-subunit alcohol dehydrogenase family)